MIDLLYWLQAISIRSFTYLYHALLVIYYWNKGKTVPPIRNPLLLKSAKTLAEDIRNGQLRSQDLIQAYIDRIQEVEPYINAVVQDQFEEALTEAAKVDKLIESKKFSRQQLEKDKPLLGIPVTFKHNFKVKGCRSTAGSKFFKDFVADEDSFCTALVKKAGGIVLATTNIPEFSMQFETNNLLFGRTCNPYNTSRTSGGSSGGESALLAAGASIIGIGNDLGGSLRIPAHFTGLYSHKPTKDLIPCDIYPPLPEAQSKYICAGPMCRYVEDLVMMMKFFSAADGKFVNFENRLVDFKKLKIYYWASIRDPRVLPVDKEIKETIHKATSHFKTTYDASVQELKMPLINKINDIVAHLLQENVENYVEFLTGGKVKEYHTFRELFKLLIEKSNFCLGTLFFLNVLKCPFIAKKQNIPYYRDLLKKLTTELDNFLDDNSVIICPTFPISAPYHTEFNFFLTMSTCFTNICNFTGMPGTAVPMGFNENGMPQGIQIISKMNNDPLTIACAVELNKVFGGWVPVR